MKELRITSSKIEVSSNPHSDKGYYVFHKVKGILPGCRKVTDLHFTAMHGLIWVRSLWSHNGNANISPEQWAALVNTSPVVSSNLDTFKVDITPAVQADAYADALRITNCEAVTSTKDVHPSYVPKFDPMVMVNGK